MEAATLRRISGHCLVWAVIASLSLVAAKPLVETGLAIDDDLAASAGCFSRETNRTYAVGEKWATGPPYMCAILECTGPDSFAALPCATFLAPDWCTEEPGDQTAVYPACCPFARCPEEPVTDGPQTPKPTNIAWEPEASNNLP